MLTYLWKGEPSPLHGLLLALRRGSSHVPPISAPHSTDLARLDNPVDFWEKSEVLLMSIEKLCLQTKNVLETYENAAAAHRSRSESKCIDNLVRMVYS
jgi:hypothetical protein